MQRFEFHISLSSDRYLDYYRGAVQQVVARCADGGAVQFPASLLQPFVTASGIHGDFVLTCDDANRGARLQRR
ncbi:MAG TPA: DUF2835 family protein [Geothrix sp.]|nr:DUF2835 family protein [Geothrix sp.]